MATYKDLDNAFKLYLDKVDSQAAPEFLPRERQQFLNDAQLRLNRELLSEKQEKQGVVDSRLSLQAYEEIVPGAGGGSNPIKLPDNYMRYGHARGQLKDSLGGGNIPVRIISQDEFSKLIQDPFNTPQAYDPIAVFVAGGARLYPGNTFQSFDLHYYKRWQSLDYKLPDKEVEPAEEHIPTIVQYAVQLALESVGDARFPTQSAISQLTQKQ